MLYFVADGFYAKKKMFEALLQMNKHLITKLRPAEILTFYQLRFQIEFLFRDAKQFTGLTHCQARDEAKFPF